MENVTVDLEQVRPQIAELCAAYGIMELAVFGSFARGEDKPGSDIDLLYVRDPSAMMGFVKLTRFQEELERLFGRPVDLAPKDGLHWAIRDRVLADAQVLVRQPADGLRETRFGERNGVTTFDVGRVITSEDVRSLDDEE
jgi:predicted nucleotidyltransferase